MKLPHKLLFVDNSIDSFYSYRMPLALAALQAGFEVHVAAPAGRCEQIISDKGITVHSLPLTRSGMNPLQEIATIRYLVKFYSDFKPDVIHHLRLKPMLYGGIAAYLANVPAEVSMPTGLGHVFTADTVKARAMRALTLLGCRFAFRHKNLKVIFQNPDDRSVFVKSQTLSKQRSVLIKGSGVDVFLFVPTPEPEGTPVIVLPARMLRDKGVEDFVAAATILKKDGVTARFVLVGDTDPGNPTAISTHQLEQWRNSGTVEWWGFQEDMKAVMARSNIVCLPSYREGLPKALIEAAAAGRAIVTTNVPGCREIVRHGQNGLLTPVRNPAALADALRLLIDDPELRARMAKKGRHIAVAEFSLDRVITETVEVYHQVLKNRAPGKSKRQSASSEQPKRLLDIGISFAGLIVLAPFLGLIALAIKLSSPGPILYRGVRVGRNNEPFRILKFRSMIPNAEKLGGSATAKDDRRITAIGKLLRRLKLDELPQLANVLKGDMSLVGPRPEVQKFVDLYTPRERPILGVKPGITDWASIWNSNEAEVLEGSPDPELTYEELIRPTKLALQLKYVEEHSVTTDLKILLHTAIKLLYPAWIPGDLTTYEPVKRYRTTRKPFMYHEDTMQELDTPAAFGGTAALPHRLRFIAPTLPPLADVMETYQAAYSNGLITNADCVGRFEAKAAEYLGVKYCVAVSSCTSGLTLVMRALGLTGEVIVPSFTFFATGHAVRWNGLRPVFADCDPETWNIDPSDVERKITPRTSAILAVHMYGNPCNVDALTEIASRYNLKLIFDAAHAFGSCYRGRPVGQFGDAEVFSLSPTKLLVAGEGGLVGTNNEVLAQSLKVLRNYGDNGSYDPEFVGANARMSEFNAALALGGLTILEEKVQRRKKIARQYTELLGSLPGVSFQKTDSSDVHTYKDYSIHVDSDRFGLSRDELGKALLAENIETKKYFYPPLHKQKLYKGFQSCPLPNTDYVADNILSLPIYESLADSTIVDIANAIKRLHAYELEKSKDKAEVLYATAKAWF